MTVWREAEVMPHRQSEAIKRRDERDPVREITSSYNVHGTTLSRLAT